LLLRLLTPHALRRPRVCDTNGVGRICVLWGGAGVLQCVRRRLHVMWPGVLCVRLGLWLGVGRERVVVVYMGRVRLRVYPDVIAWDGDGG
jgi:hypothetical protein